ncbi:MAG: hypothetical protein EAZ18_00320 [Oscillatoriales cyanobacterium]|nr:MAG: hypothetical protein EAZ18_00320 [Oscillatoriales cyanobacterium]
MALITCPECSGKVASTAISCPHCGAPVAGKRSTQIEGANALILLGSCVAGLFLGLVLSGLAGEDNLNLKVALGFAGLIAPPAAALYWSSRRQ